ncbi:class I SAM-dependent methyltransferase [Myxococcota bacterium]|nr:class I SAM-dependent methyltransferase [Myxococcota bacterium]MBU1509055.1 class I SAM-dependent methyltransferase [Myxococcota bacterium]
MPTEREVYERHAEMYERLIGFEDHQGNLIDAIGRCFRFNGADVVESGAGTGRLTRLLAPHVNSIRAFDASAHMIEVAADHLRRTRLTNWVTGVADHRRLPVDDACADLYLSGWSFSYLDTWGGDAWEQALADGVREIECVLRPGGTAILIETLGTGTGTPVEPPHLARYFAWLRAAGFELIPIRTDYRFASVEEAVELVGFFFGEELAQQVRLRNEPTLPECTGLWWKRMKK